jgi:serine/threonine-protein kinase SRPK3
VAIKIIKKAHDSTDDLDKDPEIQAMRDLEKYYIKGSQDRPRGFIQLFDWFRHEGPNGIHNCLVMELLGPSLETALRTNIMMEDFLAPDTIRRTSRQLLEAIEFIHQAGFVHGGMSVLITSPPHLRYAHPIPGSWI